VEGLLALAESLLALLALADVLVGAIHHQGVARGIPAEDLAAVQHPYQMPVAVAHAHLRLVELGLAFEAGPESRVGALQIVGGGRTAARYRW